MAIKKRFILTVFLLLVLLFILFYYSLILGSIKLSHNDIINFILNKTTGNKIKDIILIKLRLVRSLSAIIAGVAISVAGVYMQSYFRNPLADPYLTGIASGAALGVVIYGFTNLFLNYSSIWIQIGMAYLFSLITMLIVIKLAEITKQVSTLLICGIMIGAILSGFIDILVYTADILNVENNKLQGFLLWGMGSFNNLTMKEVKIMTFLTLPILLLSYIFLSKKLDAYLLGEMYAMSVGVDIKRLKRYLILLSSFLIASIISFTGPIAFIGLICPLLARMFLKTSKHLYVIPITALFGAVLLLLSDILVRPHVIIKTSIQLPLLAPLSIIGSPIAVILYLKYRRLGL
ncbi:ABC transporter integral membrane subunit [Methanocaldococcus villosus KIN24-T80]|uniref:ABC transporter integral membrane subunit n=1 Tax=Methanocaldococcus villosus KIN24-T80 TaxID=1069083 RepID=N6V334_9EURY|nr:iron ABC transporter permease [Methanocaldococcus villosus]ENN96658.1 ABC transporter integral membrane subunit [Methanocaldococcus villosus KIN24-T80]